MAQPPGPEDPQPRGPEDPLSENGGREGQSPPPAYGQSPPPAYGQSPPPAYGQSPPPAYGQSPPPAYGQPAYGQQPSSFGGGPGSPPGMGKRLLARIIDGVIIGIPFGILYGVLIAGAVANVETDPVTGEVTSGAGFFALIIPVVLLLGLLTLLYEVGLIATRGATVGKSLMKIKVVREADGQLPGWGPSILRWLIPFAGSFVCGIGQYVVYLSPFFDNSGRQQGWHDKVAKTQVVSTE